MRIDLAAVDLDGRVDGVARGARAVVHDHPVLAQQGVQQRALADVRPADDADGGRAPGRIGGRRRVRQPLDHGVEQVAHPAAVLRRDRVGVAEAQAAQVLGLGLLGGAVGLVGHQHHRPAAAAQAVGDLQVAGGRRGRDVHDEHDQVGILDPAQRLRGDLAADVGGVGLVDAAGVQQLEGAPVPLGAGLAAVARDAGGGVDHGVAAAREAVEERRLADVRVAHDRHHGLVGLERAAGRPAPGGPRARRAVSHPPPPAGPRPGRGRRAAAGPARRPPAAARRPPPSCARRPPARAGCAVPVPRRGR